MASARPYVVYAADGWAAPLAELYWSSESAALVSAHPSSSSVEIDSVFCRECLELYSDADAAAHRGRCADCVACPICATTLRALGLPVDAAGNGAPPGALRWSYACAHCCWTSAENGLEAESPDGLAMMRALWEHADPKRAAFDELATLRDQRPGEATHGGGDDEAVEGEEEGGEASLGAAAPWPGRPGGPGAAPAAGVPPPRLALAARCTRRCRRDVVAGRAGILYKPKPRPLDGDSSTRSSSGWAKKDASAVLAVPRVAVATARRGRDALTFVVEVRNPTSNPVEIRLLGADDGGARALEHLVPSLRAAHRAARCRDATECSLAAAPVSLSLEATFDDDDDDDDDDDGEDDQPEALLASAGESVAYQRGRRAAWVRVEASFALASPPREDGDADGGAAFHVVPLVLQVEAAEGPPYHFPIFLYFPAGDAREPPSDSR
ncbi:dynactin p62 family-domain-containing protein [Pelagophyceae sp. CCMP2097]|nr:dynactin p62 family-domain-containing protein [Pelagophyceae sp. CCMP2097]